MTQDKIEEIKNEWNSYVKSEQFKEAITNSINKNAEIRIIISNQIERFHTKYGNDLYTIINKIKAKYESGSYWKREYKLGREPNTVLYWFLLNYARKYGSRIPNKHYKNYKYLNTFTSEAYLLDRFLIQIMDGQGSVVHVDELPEDFTVSKKDTYVLTFGKMAVTFFMDKYCAEHSDINEKLKHKLFKLMDMSNQHYLNFKAMSDDGYYILFYKNTTLKFIKDMFNNLIKEYPEHKDLITGGINYVVTKFRTLKIDAASQNLFTVKKNHKLK